MTSLAKDSSPLLGRAGARGRVRSPGAGCVNIGQQPGTDAPLPRIINNGTQGRGRLPSRELRPFWERRSWLTAGSGLVAGPGSPRYLFHSLQGSMPRLDLKQEGARTFCRQQLRQVSENSCTSDALWSLTCIAAQNSTDPTQTRTRRRDNVPDRNWDPKRVWIRIRYRTVSQRTWEQRLPKYNHIPKVKSRTIFMWLYYSFTHCQICTGYSVGLSKH